MWLASNMRSSIDEFAAKPNRRNHMLSERHTWSTTTRVALPGLPERYGGLALVRHSRTR